MKKIRVCTLGSRERLEWRRYVAQHTVGTPNSSGVSRRATSTFTTNGNSLDTACVTAKEGGSRCGKERQWGGRGTTRVCRLSLPRRGRRCRLTLARRGRRKAGDGWTTSGDASDDVRSK
eukprot:30087-Pelagococcus_subviridis.AAC.39